ncbi:MAG: peptide chain release factor N(5)-glutamine methyltransferase [Oscillospiraceae bacterium]|nr:peptide chain release factor N(5)-glutamine methyltransferase [Oscillospiraceae bacterium]
MKTYNDIYLAARRRLKAAGVEGFQVEARLIACAAAGKTKEELFRDLKLYVTDTYEAKVEDMLRRRIEGEPVAQITGEWEFMGYPIQVTPDVLIPRIDTEVLAETAIDHLRSKEVSGSRVLDLCTGSGCVGIAIAKNVPDCRLVLLDKSLKALAVCRNNVFRNNLARCIMCLDADVLKPPPMLIGRFDLIVANPPYIPSGELGELDSSVKDYEPRMALDGGEDGLMFYRSIASKWKSVLKDNGWLMMECGEGQAEAIEEILRRCGFTDLARYQDTIGVDRVVVGRVTNPYSIHVKGE